MRKTTVFLCLLAFACGPPTDHRNEYQKSGTYPIEGKCVEPVASVVIERNGRFDVVAATGSSFLVNRGKGIFLTAEHVIELDTEYKIFFCGKVYKARRILDPGVADVGFLKITDDFDPLTFPKPYELAESAQVGEQVFIRGIHLHPKEFQKEKNIHLIVQKYYGLSITAEFVYDDLSAIVISKDILTSNSEIGGRDVNELDKVVLKNFRIRAIYDHIISFGGLSGGPTVNRHRQVVGINSTELGSEGQMVLEFDGIIHYYPRVTLNLLPIDDLKGALERLVP